MNIVFVCGGYYPNSSATGNCVRQIATRFSDLGHNVYVVCKSPEGKNGVGSYERHQLCWTVDKRLAEAYKISIAEHNVIKSVKSIMHKSFWAIYMLSKKDGMDDKLITAYSEQLKMIAEETRIDAVISCCMPIEAVKAAYDYHSSSIAPMFTLLYDPYSENVNFFRYKWSHKIRKHYAEQIENEIFNASTFIFYVDNWKEYFIKHNYKNAVRVEHPLVIRKEFKPKPLQNQTAISTIYQGEINKQMRPPEAMIEAFEYLTSHDQSISLHVFASGNGIDAVKAFSLRHPKNVMFYGRVEKSEADQYFAAADIAIILANKQSEIVPSKIFECIASGYPIVYFYYSESENSYQLLLKYPLVYFISQNDHSPITYEALLKWMHENKESRVDYEIVKARYSDATPDYVVDEVIRYMDGDIHE